MQINLCSLKLQRDRLQTANLAPNTHSTYRHAWNRFERWCAEAQIEPLPCTPENLSLYMVSVIGVGLTYSTLLVHLHAIGERHRRAGLPSPIDDSIRELTARIRRSVIQPSRAKTALTVRQLTALAASFDPSSPIAVRNCAMFVLGFASALRRSEISQLCYSDFEFVPQGLIIHVRKSKTDQIAEGRSIGIWPGKRAEICPVETLRKWIALRGPGAGRLFCRVFGSRIAPERGIGGESISRALQRALKGIGADPAKYGGHSLRAGCITTAVMAGASVLSIMQRTGHRSVQTVQRYVRTATVFDVNPLQDAL